MRNYSTTSGYERQSDYDSTTVPYGKARVWVGVKKDAYPSEPVNRRMTNSFTAANIVGECDDGFVFECGGTWLLPADEECFVEVFWHFEKEDTPWNGEAEGHSRWIPLKTAEKYDATRIERKTGVNPLETRAIDEKNDQKPEVEEKTPAAVTESPSGTSDEPAKADDVAQGKPATRRRGRPKGSRDSRPRRRRTRAEIAADEQKVEPKADECGLTLSDSVAWIADSSGYYRSYKIWLGGDWPQVEINGGLINLPMNALVWKKGPKPAMLKRWEQGLEKSWLPDVV